MYIIEYVDMFIDTSLVLHYWCRRRSICTDCLLWGRRWRAASTHLCTRPTSPARSVAVQDSVGHTEQFSPRHSARSLRPAHRSPKCRLPRLCSRQQLQGRRASRAATTPLRTQNSRSIRRRRLILRALQRRDDAVSSRGAV